MERNADDTFGATGGQANTGSTGSFGTGGSGITGNSNPSAGVDYATSSNTTSTTTTDKGEQAKAAVQEKFGQVKDKARELQSSLADRLDAGAEKLRQRNQSSALAGATDTATVGVATDDRMANVQDSVARGMQKSADWLRNGDLKADIERQVRENPGRTLLIALGLGYVLGKAFRGGNNNR
jgi:hypothetical protein